MSAEQPATAPLLVACLCAAWCRTCDDYRATFDALAAAPEAAGERWVWVDIEDDEALLGDIDVDDFPTLLVARGAEVMFFGPLLPHAATARQLLARARAGELRVSDDTRLAALAQRIAA